MGGLEGLTDYLKREDLVVKRLVRDRLDDEPDSTGYVEAEKELRKLVG